MHTQQSLEKLDQLLSSGIPDDLARQIRACFEEQNQELKVKVAELEDFAQKCVKVYCWGFGLDGGDVQEWAEQHNIIERVDFNPEIHNDNGIGLDAGDDFYVFTKHPKQSLAERDVKVIRDFVAEYEKHQFTGRLHGVATIKGIGEFRDDYISQLEQGGN